jgi:4-diphosphocytidyl-2-C-methyl-D-erythritol kinase
MACTFPPCRRAAAEPPAGLVGDLGGEAVSAFAPAKINLYLHVVGRRADGYHLLDSLIAFTDIGDRVTAVPADRLSLTVGGPEAGALAGLGDDNLVLRAARLLAEEAGRKSSGVTPYRAALHLDKVLPEASGIGGGSSDAAAALHALDRLWHHPLDPDALAALALKLGADVPACLAARPVWVGGIGERIEPAAGLPPAGIVLANPRRRLPTADVFAARRGALAAGGRFAAMPRDAAGLAAVLESRRNDLTEAALTIVPEIATVLDRLARLPGALIARMSGSGATCFALFADRAASRAAGAVLACAEPSWWSAAGALTTAQGDELAG